MVIHVIKSKQTPLLLGKDLPTELTQKSLLGINKLNLSRSGNFIIGASGSDKQMLCESSGARAALNIAAEKSKQKR